MAFTKKRLPQSGGLDGVIKCRFVVETPGGRFSKSFPASSRGYINALKQGGKIAGGKIRSAGNVADVQLICAKSSIFIATCDPALREKDLEGNIFCTTRFSQRARGDQVTIDGIHKKKKG